MTLLVSQTLNDRISHGTRYQFGSESVNSDIQTGISVRRVNEKKEFRNFDRSQDLRTRVYFQQLLTILRHKK